MAPYFGKPILTADIKMTDAAKQIEKLLSGDIAKVWENDLRLLLSAAPEKREQLLEHATLFRMMFPMEVMVKNPKHSRYIHSPVFGVASDIVSGSCCKKIVAPIYAKGEYKLESYGGIQDIEEVAERDEDESLDSIADPLIYNFLPAYLKPKPEPNPIEIALGKHIVTRKTAGGSVVPKTAVGTVVPKTRSFQEEQERLRKQHDDKEAAKQVELAKEAEKNKKRSAKKHSNRASAKRKALLAGQVSSAHQKLDKPNVKLNPPAHAATATKTSPAVLFEACTEQKVTSKNSVSDGFNKNPFANCKGFAQPTTSSASLSFGDLAKPKANEQSTKTLGRTKFATTFEFGSSESRDQGMFGKLATGFGSSSLSSSLQQSASRGTTPESDQSEKNEPEAVDDSTSSPFSISEDVQEKLVPQDFVPTGAGLSILSKAASGVISELGKSSPASSKQTPAVKVPSFSLGSVDFTLSTEADKKSNPFASLTQRSTQIPCEPVAPLTTPGAGAKEDTTNETNNLPPPSEDGLSQVSLPDTDDRDMEQEDGARTGSLGSTLLASKGQSNTKKISGQASSVFSAVPRTVSVFKFATPSSFSDDDSENEESVEPIPAKIQAGGPLKKNRTARGTQPKPAQVAPKFEKMAELRDIFKTNAVVPSTLATKEKQTLSVEVANDTDGPNGVSNTSTLAPETSEPQCGSPKNEENTGLGLFLRRREDWVASGPGRDEDDETAADEDLQYEDENDEPGDDEDSGYEYDENEIGEEEEGYLSDCDDEVAIDENEEDEDTNAGEDFGEFEGEDLEGDTGEDVMSYAKSLIIDTLPGMSPLEAQHVFEDTVSDCFPGDFLSDDPGLLRFIGNLNKKPEQYKPGCLPHITSGGSLLSDPDLRQILGASILPDCSIYDSLFDDPELRQFMGISSGVTSVKKCGWEVPSGVLQVESPSLFLPASAPLQDAGQDLSMFSSGTKGFPIEQPNGIPFEDSTITEEVESPTFNHNEKEESGESLRSGELEPSYTPHPGSEDPYGQPDSSANVDPNNSPAPSLPTHRKLKQDDYSAEWAKVDIFGPVKKVAAWFDKAGVPKRKSPEVLELTPLTVPEAEVLGLLENEEHLEEPGSPKSPLRDIAPLMVEASPKLKKVFRSIVFGVDFEASEVFDGSRELPISTSIEPSSDTNLEVDMAASSAS
ncbi:hypothetical protein P154DRAFT_609017 [Amniculicola lignicola CBS 123094]|uniref:Uncharacterized protein n=1 Tax=Amniculicola lignicola CBS 123094 TaxID=1392246 RepID=A0A6A5W4X2_9PLEO|nr:hypothetical protein P154DRAFT_609017 [Amniculicola lignicola CBS 123094]